MARLKFRISKTAKWILIIGFVLGCALGSFVHYAEQVYEPDYVKADPEFQWYLTKYFMLAFGEVFTLSLFIAAITEAIIRLRRRWKHKQLSEH